MSTIIAWLRSVFAVVVGYVVFAVSTFMIFRLSGKDAHASASASYMAMTIVAGVLLAFAGGYVAAWLAGRKPVTHAAAMALILAAGASVSLAATIGKGAIWSQIAALALMAPSAVMGGRVRARVKQPS